MIFFVELFNIIVNENYCTLVFACILSQKNLLIFGTFPLYIFSLVLRNMILF